MAEQIEISFIFCACTVLQEMITAEGHHVVAVGQKHFQDGALVERPERGCVRARGDRHFAQAAALAVQAVFGIYKRLYNWAIIV